MLKVAKVAFDQTRNEMDRMMDKTHDFTKLDLNYTSICSRLFELASNLAIISEVMYTLDAGLSRSQLEIVNKPEVKEF